MRTTNGVPLDTDSFPDPAFRTAVAKAFDTDGDSMLSPDEIRNATFLDASRRGITSVKGVELLRSLTTLDLHGNSLREFSIAGAAFPALLQIDLSHNRLERVDVSRDLNLGEIWLDANQPNLRILLPPDARIVDAEGNAFDSDTRTPSGLHHYERSIAVMDWKEKPKTISTYTSQGVPLDEKHFPDPRFLRIVSTFDKDGDGWLFDEDESDVTVLNLANEGIRDISGIEHFPRLRTIDLTGNRIPKIKIGEFGFPRFIGHMPHEPLGVFADHGVDVIYYDSMLNSKTLTNQNNVNIRIYRRGDVYLKGCFPDDALRACVAEAFDKDGDGWLTVDDIRHAKSLDASNRGISRDDGLEYLPNLEQLNLSHNALTHVALVSNGKLTDCDLSHNQLTNVAFPTPWLDLPGYSELSPSPVAPSRETTLQRIDLSFNRISEVDCHNLRQTTPLIITADHGSKMVREDDSLVAVTVLHTGNAYLEGCIPDKNLRVALARFDSDGDGWLTAEELRGITRLDVSYHLSTGGGIPQTSWVITSLRGIELLPNLQYLNCENQRNILIDIDVSRNSLLQELCLNNTATSEIIGLPQLSDLRKLHLRNTTMTSLDLSHNTKLTTLDVTDCANLATVILPPSMSAESVEGVRTNIWGTFIMDSNDRNLHRVKITQGQEES